MMTLSEILAFHDSVYNQCRPALLNTAKAGVIDDYDGLSYGIHGLLSMAEATGDVKRLDRAVEILSLCQAAAKDLTGDGLREWGPLSGGKPNQLIHFKIAACFARAAAIIQRNAAFSSVYSTQAAAFAKLAREVSVGYWVEREYKGAVPWLAVANGGWGTYKLSQDRTSHLGACVAHLSVATGEVTAKDLARKISTDFKGKWKDDGKGGAIWDVGLPLTEWKAESFPNAHAAPDTSHANAEPMMMVAAFEAGIPGVTVADLTKLGDHLVKVMWNGSLTNPMITNYIDGNNSAFQSEKQPGGIGNIMAGWAYLGRIHPGVQSVADSILSCMAKGIKNPTVNYNASDVGQLALSGALYRSRFPIFPLPPSGELVLTASRMDYGQGGELTTLTPQQGQSVVSLCAKSKPFTLVSGGNIHGVGVGSAGRVVAVDERVLLLSDGVEWFVF